MFYFAYGSNLSEAQMRTRCPSAVVVGRAWLPNHRLVFKGWSGGWGGAVASIEPAEGCQVEGAVYEIRDEDDVLWLDYHEGCPTVYRAERVRVRMDKHQRLRCWTYVKVAGEEGWPSTRYARQIADGLKAHGHTVATLAAALTKIAPAPAPRPVTPAPVKRAPSPWAPRPVQGDLWGPPPPPSGTSWWMRTGS